MKRLGVVVLAMLCCGALLGAERERVLLPVSVSDVPGAFGSQWTSELWVHVSGEDGAIIEPLRLTHLQPIRGTMRLHIWYRAPGEPPGQFLTVEREANVNVHLNLRIREVVTQPDTWGTEIPVVWERDFYTEPITLLPLPLGTNFRGTLRVYATAPGAVRVTVKDTVTQVVYEERELTLNPDREGAPAYGELSLAGLGSNDGTARVEITPVGDMHFWSFMSVTHNATQNVTTLVPHRE